MAPSSLLCLLAVLWAGGAAVVASTAPLDEPVADPAAIVEFGRLRLTMLSPSLVRIEQSETKGAWDDRATLQIVNRRLPVPQFTAAKLNATAMVVTTSVLRITLGSDGSEGAGTQCATNPGHDWSGGTQRSKSYPEPVNNTTLEGCCALCDADPDCKFFSYGSGGEYDKACWPLSQAGGGVVAAPDRIAGTKPSPSTLLPVSIEFTGPDGRPATWVPGTVDNTNLNGTYPALDCYSTPMQCNDVYHEKMQPGLLSRAGWAIIDDSGTGRLVPAPDRPAGIPYWWTLDAVNHADLYFQAFPDMNYSDAMASWMSILGRPAMLPRSAFGVWWSRYWEYTQDSIVTEVLDGYKNFSIPLNNLVFDMDWHDEPKEPGCQTWGNYDVNTNLFPDFRGFAEQLHEHGNVTGNPLKLSVNVHPQTGVDHCDKRYKQFAEAMGVEPASNATISCDFGNKTFYDSLTSIYYDAEPLHNVDIWWTDYSGCGVSAGNPQLWNNLVINQHQQYSRHTRGQAFSRYGGLGNHRYPHGFSGDTFQHEVSLYWQVKTTQTAANVLWGYWSHDIGGFHTGKGCPGVADPKNVTGSELFLRWIQWGAVAPILRTHCDHCERRIWLFPYFDHMRDAMRLRNALTPYIYTASRRFYDTGVAPLHPLYYDFGTDDKVYEQLVVEREYMFGERILAQPVTSVTGVPNGTLDGWETYLPAGKWSNWNGSTVIAGPATVRSAVALSEIPLFVRDGGLVPLKTMSSVADDYPTLLVWTVWPGAAQGNYTLYEDDGDSDAYQGGEFATTTASFTGGDGKVFTLAVGGAVSTGALPTGFPVSRSHSLQLRGVAAAGKAVSSVSCNGTPVAKGEDSWYVSTADTLAESTGALVVACPAVSSFDAVAITVVFA